MKYFFLFLLLAVAACQQPTTSSYMDADVSAKRGASSVIAIATGVVTWTNNPGQAGQRRQLLFHPELRFNNL